MGKKHEQLTNIIYRFISFGAVLLKGDYPHPMAYGSLCLRLPIFVT